MTCLSWDAGRPFLYLCALACLVFQNPETAASADAPPERPRWSIIEAEDRKICRVEGPSAVQVYPRTVGRQALMLLRGSRLTVLTDAGAGDLPVLNIPRTGPPPLRVDFAEPNDGTAGKQTAVVTNEFPNRFARGRLRFVVRRGDYRVEGAQVLQEFDSDDGKRTVIDAGFDVNAGQSVRVTVEQAGEGRG